MLIDYGRMQGAARRLSSHREAVLDELPLHHPDTGASSAETSTGLDTVARACRQLERDLARIATGVVDTCDDFWRTDDAQIRPGFQCLPWEDPLSDGAESGGAESGGAESGGAESGGAESGGAESGGAESDGSGG
ncbi:hypothetical protein [Nocardioides pacificus]